MIGIVEKKRTGDIIKLKLISTPRFVGCVFLLCRWRGWDCLKV